MARPFYKTLLADLIRLPLVFHRLCDASSHERRPRVAFSFLKTLRSCSTLLPRTNTCECFPIVLLSLLRCSRSQLGKGYCNVADGFRRLLFELRSLRRCENQACTCGGQVRIRIALARQRDHGFRECLAHFVGVVLVCYEGRRSCGNIRQCAELVCADGCQHGDDRPFRTRVCQFFGRIPAHEAETVREQQHTYNHSARSGPQRGFCDFPIDSHLAFLRFEGNEGLCAYGPSRV